MPEGPSSWMPLSVPLVAFSCALELALMLWIGVGVTQRLASFLQLCPDGGFMRPSSIGYGHTQGLGAEIEACGSSLLQPYVPALRLPPGSNRDARAAHDTAVRDIAKLLQLHAPGFLTSHCAIGGGEGTTSGMCSIPVPWLHSAGQVLAQAWHYIDPGTLWRLGEATMAVREVHLVLHIILAACFPGLYSRTTVRASLFISDRLTTWAANIPALLFARGPHITLGTTLYYSLAKRRSGVLFVGMRALTTRVPFRLQVWVALAEWVIVVTIMTLVDQRLYGHVLMDTREVLTSFLAVAVVPTAIVWMYEQRKLNRMQSNRRPPRQPSPPFGPLQRSSTGQPHCKSASMESFTTASSSQPWSALLPAKQGLESQTAEATAEAEASVRLAPAGPAACSECVPQAEEGAAGKPAESGQSGASATGGSSQFMAQDSLTATSGGSAITSQTQDSGPQAGAAGCMKEDAGSSGDSGAPPRQSAPEHPRPSATGPVISVTGSSGHVERPSEATPAQPPPAPASDAVSASALLSSVRPDVQQRLQQASQECRAPHGRPSLSWRGRTRAVPVSIKVTQYPGDYHTYANRLRAAALQGSLSRHITQTACSSASPGAARVVAATCVRGCVQLLAFAHGLAPGAWAARAGPEGFMQEDVEDLLLDSVPGPAQVVGGLQAGGALEGMRHAALRILYVDPVVVASSSSEGATFRLGVSAPAAGSSSYPARIVVATSSEGATPLAPGTVAAGGDDSSTSVGGLLAETLVDLPPGYSEVAVQVAAHLPGPSEGARDLGALIIWLLPVPAGTDAAEHAMQPLPSMLSTAVIPVLPPGPAVAEMQRLWQVMQQEFEAQIQVEQQFEGGAQQGPAEAEMVLTSLTTTQSSTTSSAAPSAGLGYQQVSARDVLEMSVAMEARAAVFREHWQGVVQDLVWVAAQLRALGGGPAPQAGSVEDASWEQLKQVRCPLCEYLTDQGLHSTAALIHCSETEHHQPAAAHEEGHTGEGDSGRGSGVGHPPEGYYGGVSSAGESAALPQSEGFYGGAHLQYFTTGQPYLHDGTSSDDTKSPLPGLTNMFHIWTEYPIYKQPGPAKCATVPLLVKPCKAMDDTLVTYHTAPRATCLMARAVGLAASEAIINAAATQGLTGAWQAGVPGAWPKL